MDKKQLLDEFFAEADFMNTRPISWETVIKSHLQAIELYEKGVRAEDIK